MRKITIFLLLFIPFYGWSQKKEEFASAETSFFSSCIRQFNYIQKVHSEPYTLSGPNCFPPSTMYLFIDLKETFPTRAEFLKYIRSVHSGDISDITGNYTILYNKKFESQLQIILIVSAVGVSIDHYISMEIL